MHLPAQEDYDAMTRAMLECAEAVCEGRLISILEGGFRPEVLARCCTSHLLTLMTPVTGRLRKNASVLPSSAAVPVPVPMLMPPVHLVPNQLRQFRNTLHLQQLLPGFTNPPSMSPVTSTSPLPSPGISSASSPVTPVRSGPFVAIGPNPTTPITSAQAQLQNGATPTLLPVTSSPLAVSPAQVPVSPMASTPVLAGV